MPSYHASNVTPLVPTEGHVGARAEPERVDYRRPLPDPAAPAPDPRHSEHSVAAVRLSVPAASLNLSSAVGQAEGDGAPNATLALVDTLVATLELRHPFFRGGSTLVRLVAEAISRELGLSDEDRLHVALAALLRDLGRVGQGEELDRPKAQLTPEDRRKIEAHVDVGLALLEGADLIPEVHAAIRHHHERWDGQGYPDGLAGESIPLLARILAVADAFVAMIQPRAYRSARRAPAAMEELAREAGAQFDPAVVAAANRALVGAQGNRLGFSLRQHVMIVHARSSEGTALLARLCSHGYVAEQVTSVAEAMRRLDRVPVEALLVRSGKAFPAARELIEALRADPRFETLPAVAFDTRSPGERVALLEAGVDVALPHGVTFQELRGTLAAILWRSEQLGASRGTQEREPWHQLEGRLQDFSLAFLLQALQYDGRDGTVHVRTTDGGEGLVLVEQGVPRHARAGDLMGEEALGELLAWNDGRFRFEPGPGQGEHTIEAPLMRILLQVLATEDEANVFGAVLR